ncbi:MAG: segregation/condensation protein A [Planctomycetes bacterium]|nr:segregation/condensation protein A [Planctomycetota bacterium]
MIQRSGDFPPQEPRPDQAKAAVQEPVPATPPTARKLWDDGFCTQLDDYSGPLELLLYLIHKNELDILDIPIATILEQFLAHVTEARRSATLDLRQAGDYLVMSARLMEIKVRMLSPGLIEEEDDLLEEELEDPRQHLVEQLLEYRDFKERAQLLEEAHRVRSLGYERRQDDLPPPPPGTLDLSEVSSHDVAAAFQRILDRLREQSSFTFVAGEDVPVEQAMAEILEQLRGAARKVLPFDQLFPEERGIPGAISTFLAILELARLNQLQLEQATNADPLLVHLRENG